MFNQEKQYLTREQIQDINNKLYKIESELEGIGRQTCSVYSGGQYWSTVNDAIDKVQELIRTTWRLKDPNNF